MYCLQFAIRRKEKILTPPHSTNHTFPPSPIGGAFKRECDMEKMSKEILMNTNKFTISWGDFSRYRSSMFGLSIIGIMVFHYFEHIRSAHLLLKSEQFWDYYIGSTGVDFLLFLSGMGLFYSLTKNDDICQFYKKRLVRILPA